MHALAVVKDSDSLHRYTETIAAEAVERWTIVGQAIPEDEEASAVYVTQRDDFDWTAHPVEMTRTSTTILALERRFSPETARSLAQNLLRAAELIEAGIY
jgi:hypothetical protein